MGGYFQNEEIPDTLKQALDSLGKLIFNNNYIHLLTIYLQAVQMLQYFHLKH